MKEPQTGANKKGEPDREDLSGKLVRVSVAGHNSDMRYHSTYMLYFTLITSNYFCINRGDQMSQLALSGSFEYL